MHLVNDTEAPTDNVTSDPRVQGYLSRMDAGTVNGLKVQFDVNGDAIADGYVFSQTDGTGRFEIDPSNALSGNGPVTLAVRAGDSAAVFDTDFSGWQTFSFTWAPPTPAPSSTVAAVTDLHLVNDTGTAADQITTDGRLAGQLTNASGAVAWRPVEYDVDADGAADGVIYANATGAFTVDARRISPETGAKSLAFRSYIVGSDGTRTSGIWQSLAFTLDAVVEPQVTDLRLVQDTGADDDLVTSNPRVAGVVTPLSSTSRTQVEFDLDGDENAEGTVFPDAEGHFTINLGPHIVAGPVTLRARTQTFDSDALDLFSGEWQTFTFTYAPAPLVPPEIAALQLVHDTGVAGDRITADSRLQGLVVRTDGGELSALPVEFDLDGDGIAEGQVSSDLDGNGYFQIDPSAFVTTAGTVTIAVRAGLPGATADEQFGDWQTLEFTYERVSSAALPVIGNLHLEQDTGDPADFVTADPRVAGTITRGIGSVDHVPIYYDLDGDGLADGTATTVADGSGQFVIDLSAEELADGPVLLRVRAEAFDADRQQLVRGAWQEFNFTYEAATVSLPQVSELEIAGLLGPFLVLAGSVSRASGENSRLLVQYCLGEEGSLQTNAANSTGAFEFSVAQAALADGPVTLYVRALDADKYGQDLPGEWTTLTLSLDSAAPAISSLQLAAGVDPDEDGVTSTPRLSGLVTGVTDLDALPIQFDLDGDGIADGSTFTLPEGDGEFLIDLTGAQLTAGPVTVAVRAGVWDAVAAAFRYGEWSEVTFTYAPPAAPAVAQLNSLHLVVDTGTAGDNITSDRRIGGTVTRSGASVTALPVQFDTNGDGTAEGSVYTSTLGDGTFVADVSAFVNVPGDVTVRLRVGTVDAATGEYAYGEWVDFEFEYDASAGGSGGSGGSGGGSGGSGQSGLSDTLPTTLAPDSIVQDTQTNALVDVALQSNQFIPNGSFNSGVSVPLDIGTPSLSQGEFHFESWATLANPFATPAAAEDSSVQDDIDTFVTSADGMTTVDTNVSSELVTQITFQSGGGWTKHMALELTYEITTVTTLPGGNITTLHQQGSHHFMLDVTVTASGSGTYSLDESWGDTFTWHQAEQTSITLGDGTTGTQSRTLNRAGQQSRSLIASGARSETASGLVVTESATLTSSGQNISAESRSATGQSSASTSLSSNWAEVASTTRTVTPATSGGSPSITGTSSFQHASAGTVDSNDASALPAATANTSAYFSPGSPGNSAPSGPSSVTSHQTFATQLAVAATTSSAGTARIGTWDSSLQTTRDYTSGSQSHKEQSSSHAYGSAQQPVTGNGTADARFDEHRTIETSASSSSTDNTSESAIFQGRTQTISTATSTTITSASTESYDRRVHRVTHSDGSFTTETLRSDSVEAGTFAIETVDRSEITTSGGVNANIHRVTATTTDLRIVHAVQSGLLTQGTGTGQSWSSITDAERLQKDQTVDDTTSIVVTESGLAEATVLVNILLESHASGTLSILNSRNATSGNPDYSSGPAAEDSTVSLRLSDGLTIEVLVNATARSASNSANALWTSNIFNSVDSLSWDNGTEVHVTSSETTSAQGDSSSSDSITETVRTADGQQIYVGTTASSSRFGGISGSHSQQTITTKNLTSTSGGVTTATSNFTETSTSTGSYSGASSFSGSVINGESQSHAESLYLANGTEIFETSTTVSASSNQRTGKSTAGWTTTQSAAATGSTIWLASAESVDNLWWRFFNFALNHRNQHHDWRQRLQFRINRLFEGREHDIPGCLDKVGGHQFGFLKFARHLLGAG